MFAVPNKAKFPDAPGYHPTKPALFFPEPGKHFTTLLTDPTVLFAGRLWD